MRVVTGLQNLGRFYHTALFCGYSLFDFILFSSCHRKGHGLTDVKPPAGFGHRCFPSAPEISTRLNEHLRPKWTASGLRKKTAPRRATFLNDFFTDAWRFFLETSVLLGYIACNKLNRSHPPRGQQHRR
jgi:hypothetical protein